jgi:hypothetical protein
LGTSFNGRTAAFGAANVGSNPAVLANPMGVQTTRNHSSIFDLGVLPEIVLDKLGETRYPENSGVHMTQKTEHLTKAEIEEKIARLVRQHRAEDPRIEAAKRLCESAFWTFVTLVFVSLALFFVSRV